MPVKSSYDILKTTTKNNPNPDIRKVVILAVGDVSSCLGIF